MAERGGSSGTLTLFCPSGLANRLRVLVSGRALAEASGRTFRMLWPRTPVCSAGFHELFANDWPVTDVDHLDRNLRAHRVTSWLPGQPPVSVSDPRPDIVLGVSGWLIRIDSPSALRARCAELLAELSPLTALQDQIEAFRWRHFRPTMIGLHLRRGDFLLKRPDVAGNTREALEALDRFLEQGPDAGVFLCTDDGAKDPRTGAGAREGVRDLIRGRYGERVVATTPRSLDRRTPEAVQDALVDLWLLRATHRLVGTKGSSFSGLAVFGRDVPHVLVGGGTVAYRRIEVLARLSGLDWLLRRRFRARRGYDETFLYAWNSMVAQPMQRWRSERRRARARRAKRWAARRQRWFGWLGRPGSG